MVANHFELKFYLDSASSRNVGKTTISSNIKRAEKTLQKNALSGSLWEAAIFSWILEQLQYISREKGFILEKFVDAQPVDTFPSRDKQSSFAVLVRSASSPPYIGPALSDLLGTLSPNPPSAGVFSSCLASLPGCFFLWQGGKSCVDFLLLAPGGSSILVFDAKVSHQTYLKSGPHVSHTVDVESLVPQSVFLSAVPDASAAVAFWTPFIGARFASQAAPDQSVTVNRSAALLEESLNQLLEKALGVLLEPSESSVVSGEG
ncbi:MAG: hypothetical protein ACFFDW_14730 [Candidatus Thorarchaeota archaeon]